MVKEIWKDIEGYDGVYQISNIGNVQSVQTYYRKRTGVTTVRTQPIKQFVNKYGYLVVTLHKNCIAKTKTVHRLIAKAFIPNPDNLPCINHKNQIKTDNRLENLEWCTYEYNNSYGDKMLRISVSSGFVVAQIDAKTNEVIRVFHSAREAGRVINSKHISECCRGERETACGYKWKYLKVKPRKNGSKKFKV